MMWHPLIIENEFTAYTVFAAPPSPVMILIDPSSNGILTAGNTYTLTCIALKTASGLTRFAQTQWTGPGGAAVATSGTIALGSAVSESLRTVQRISLSPLSTSDAGVYTCQSTLSSTALTVPYRTMQSYTMIISGTVVMFFILHLLHKMHYCVQCHHQELNYLSTLNVLSAKTR